MFLLRSQLEKTPASPTPVPYTSTSSVQVGIASHVRVTWFLQDVHSCGAKWTQQTRPSRDTDDTREENKKERKKGKKLNCKISIKSHLPQAVIIRLCWIRLSCWTDVHLNLKVLRSGFRFSVYFHHGCHSFACCLSKRNNNSEWLKQSCEMHKWQRKLWRVPVQLFGVRLLLYIKICTFCKNVLMFSGFGAILRKKYHKLDSFCFFHFKVSHK